ncbi:MAG: hypothetical protein JRN52_14625 [Nitrososphaerota archaeon]|nr:hypothetical protein [Nitrososphaerota archaeon]
MPKRHPIPLRMTSCLVCGAKDECLKVSQLWGVRRNQQRLRQVVDEIRYNKSLLPTQELEDGRRAHQALGVMRGVEKDLPKIIESINMRNPPFYMTATFCSPTFGGLRCQPDAILVEAREDTLRLLVIEDKTSNQARYYSQLYAEGVILTDRHCLIAPPIEWDQVGIGGRSDQKRIPFYPQLQGFETVLVDVTLNPYGSFEKLLNSPLNPIRFSTNYHMNPGVESKYFTVTQSKKVILKALKHPQYIEIEPSAQMKFTHRGKELKMYVPKRELERTRKKAVAQLGA